MRNTLSIRLRSLAVASFTLTSLTAGAQVVTGRVTDTDGKPLAFANIVALRAADSTFVAGTVTDADGRYRLDTKGGGLLRVSLIGYGQTFRTVAQATAMDFALAADARLLGEATVTGSRPFAYIKDDALVTNVEGTVLARMPRVNDMLGRIPGLTKTADGFEVFGKGAPVIYINSRKVRDASELDRLAPEDVKSVEVITNPGARYGADVRAVVRIRTVKRQGDGFSVSDMNYALLNHRFIDNNRLSLNYRKYGWDVTAGLLYAGGGTRTRNHSDEIRYTDIPTTFLNDSKYYSTAENLLPSLTVNYEISDKQSVGAQYMPSYLMHYKSSSISHNHIQRDGAFFDDLTTLQDTWYDHYLMHTAYAYYTGEFGKWSVDFNFTYYDIPQSNHTLVQEESQTGEGREFWMHNEQGSGLYAARLDVSAPLWKGDLSFGAEYFFSESRNQNLNEAYVPNSESNLKETLAAAYAEYRRSFGKLRASAGLRYEDLNTNYYEDGHYVAGQSRHHRNVVPNASLTWPVGKTTMQLSYAMKIRRPGYSYLRDQLSYEDRFTYRTGDPTLRPQKMQDVTLLTTWRWLTFSANYTAMQDYYTLMNEPYAGSPDILLTKSKNIGHIDAIEFGVNAQPTFGFWTPKVSLRLSKFFATLDRPTGSLDMGSPYLRGSVQNMFKIDDTWYAFFDIYFNTAGDLYGTNTPRKNWFMSASVNKTWLKGTLTTSLGIDDILNTNRNRQIYQMPYSRKYSEMNNGPCSVYLAVNYRFNAAKSRYKGTGAGASQRSRM